MYDNRTTRLRLASSLCNVARYFAAKFCSFFSICNAGICCFSALALLFPSYVSIGLWSLQLFLSLTWSHYTGFWGAVFPVHIVGKRGCTPFDSDLLLFNASVIFGRHCNDIQHSFLSAAYEISLTPRFHLMWRLWNF